MYNFEDIIERQGNGSKKWNQEYIEKRFTVKDKKKVYPLFIADMDFKLPDEIMKPMSDFISLGDFGYFDIKESFYDSIRKWYKQQYNCEINKEWIVPSIGALSSMHLIVSELFNKDDNILIFTPVYGPFKDVVLNNDMNLITHKLLMNENRYYIDFEKMENQIIEKNIKGIIFCNPHNPSGRCWGKEEIEKIISICKKNDVIIISDEVHGDLVLGDNKFISLANYLNAYNKMIVISSPNKTFNLAGLNISTFLCRDKHIRVKLEDEFNKRKLHVNRVGAKFLEICYSNGNAWVKELRHNIEENLTLVKDRLSCSGIKIIEPEAGYLIWVKLDDVQDVDEFVLNLARDTGVLLETGSRFIRDNEGFLRINIATSKKILNEAIPKIVEFYKKYKKR